MASPRHPSIARIVRLADALGPLSAEVVFIGGAIAPLLQAAPPFSAARLTRDVDGVILLPGYAAMGRLADRLRSLGFRQEPVAGWPIHRWVSHEGDLLDLVPAGEHPGASAQKWDRLAIESSVSTRLSGGSIVRHASAPVFVVLKLAAYNDRGAGDPFASHDLEDVLALIASRPGLVAEVEAAPLAVREFIGTSAAELLRRPDIEDLLAGHLNNAQAPEEIIVGVRGALAALAGGRWGQAVSRGQG